MNDTNEPAPSSSPDGANLPRLYSLSGIGFATFFGSMLAGFFLLAANYHALGMKKLAAIVIGAGLAAFCIYFVVVMAAFGPSSMSPSVGQTADIQINMTQAILSNVGQTLLLLFITNLLQGSMLTTFKNELGGTHYSAVRSIFVGFIAYLVLASVCIMLLTALGLIPAADPSTLST